MVWLNQPLLLLGAVILICILLNRFLEKIPVPSLLIFIGLGMFFGENGPFRIQFDHYALVNLVCSVCLIFIMFYGGFGTNMRAARPVLREAALMSSLGVAGTAGAVAIRSFRAVAFVAGEFSDRGRDFFDGCGFSFQHSPFAEAGFEVSYGLAP